MGLLKDLFFATVGRSPIVAYGIDYTYAGGDIADFGVSSCTSTNEIHVLMRRNGVDCWGADLNSDGATVRFTVKGEDASKVAAILRQNKIPIAYESNKVDDETVERALRGEW